MRKGSSVDHDARGDWVRVPIGKGSRPYVTMPFERTVLVVARTLTTTVWLLDFLEEVFGDDPRVQVLYTVEDERPSVYHRGAHDLLREVGAVMVPWAQACATSFDVAICSTHTGSLERLCSPLFITPHGPGFGKPASVRPGGAVPLPLEVRDRRSAHPLTTVVLSHPDQAVLFDGHPAEVRLLVAGDPAYDRMQASAWHRERYRRAFGLDDDRQLVVLTSTWGPGAQLGAMPDLALRMRRELPVDEYTLAMVIHPNIWFGHGPWQVRAWLRSAREAGVVLVPPHGDEWRAAIVAADAVAADHGSVGFYAAAIGRPVLRASFGDEYLMPDAPLAELGRLAPDLALDEPLAPQLTKLVREHDPRRYSGAVDRMFAAHGRSVAIMRDALYELIELVPPNSATRALAVGLPQLTLPPVTAHVVCGEVTSASSGRVVLQRSPAVLDDRRRQSSIGGGGGGDTSSSTRLSRMRCCSRAPRSSRGTAVMLTSSGRGGPSRGCRAVGSLQRCNASAPRRRCGHGMGVGSSFAGVMTRTL